MMGANMNAPFPMQGYPAAQPMNPFVPPNSGAAPRLPSATGLPAIAQQQVPPRPIIRAQREDDPLPPARAAQTPPRPAPIIIPTPEALGVAEESKARQDQLVDWDAVHDKLNRMGASCFRLEKLSNGGCRITCLLPGSQQGRSRHIESEAASEAEAVRAALAKAEEWSRSQ